MTAPAPAPSPTEAALAKIDEDIAARRIVDPAFNDVFTYAEDANRHMRRAFKARARARAHADATSNSMDVDKSDAAGHAAIKAITAARLATDAVTEADTRAMSVEREGRLQALERAEDAAICAAKARRASFDANEAHLVAVRKAFQHAHQRHLANKRQQEQEAARKAAGGVDVDTKEVLDCLRDAVRNAPYRTRRSDSKTGNWWTSR